MRFRQAVAVVVLVTYMPSCMGWKAAGVEPSRIPPGARDLRVTLGNGERFVLEKAVVVGDSLTGVRTLGPEVRYAKAQRTVALQDVRSLEVQKLNTAKTLLAMTGIGLFLAVVVAVASADFSLGSGGWGSGGGGWNCPGYAAAIPD